MEQKFKAYKIKGIYGVTDLVSESPYCGEWDSFIPFYDISEEDYKSDITSYEEAVRSHNESYIARLKEEGKYKEEFYTTFNIMDYEKPVADSKPNYSNVGILIPKGDIADREKIKFNFKYNG